MEIEKEVRYRVINKQKIEKIIANTEELESRNNVIDLVMGWNGFNSLNDYGFICRIRKKNENIKLECKKRVSNEEWNESSIGLSTIKEGYDFLSLLGMKPYMYINRYRQVRKYKDIDIYIDEVDMLGDFIEIEYQNTDNEKEQIESFIESFGIDSEKQKLYGDIFRERVENDKEFQKEFNSRLLEFIHNN